MNLSQTLVVKELITSLKLLKQNPLFFIIAAFIDAAFFFFFGFITSPVNNAIIAHVVLISNKISELLAQGVQKGLLYQLFTPEVSPLTYKFLLLILLLFVLIYILYVIFHGTSWWLARNMAGQKETYRKYFFGFAKINLLWMGLYALYKCIDALVGMRHVIVQKFAPGAPNILGTVITIVFAIIAITAIFSYPLLKAKTLFKTAIKISLPLIVLCWSIFIIAWRIPITISLYLGHIKYIPEVMYILAIILLFPSFVLIRVYLTRVLTNVHAHT